MSSASPPAGLPSLHLARRLLGVAAMAAVLLLLCPTIAAAKGPTELTITGDSLDGPIRFSDTSGGGEPGSGGELSRIAEHTGLFATMFGADARRLATQRPDGDLGPPLTLTWTMPTGGSEDGILVQRMHPWADGGPVTHTEGGQVVFGTETVGGWYAGGKELAGMLAAAGVPSEPPGADMTRAVAGLGGMIALGLALLMALHATRRRRRAVVVPA